MTFSSGVAAVVGRPNTGKSTFINTLARADRMIGLSDGRVTSDQPVEHAA